MPRIGFREAIGVKIAIAVLRSVIETTKLSCIDVDRVLWILNELDRFADHVVREGIAIEALEIGEYIAEEILTKIESPAKEGSPG